MVQHPKLPFLPRTSKPVEARDCDGDGVPDLMVKFDRAKVQGLVDVGENELRITFFVNNAAFKTMGFVTIS